MANEQTQRIELELDGIRFLWPNFITPVVPKDERGQQRRDQEARFDGTVMIPKTHPLVGTLRAKIREALVLEFGAAAVPENFAGYHLPIKNGDEMADKAAENVRNKVPKAKEREFCRGFWLLATKSGKDYPPALAAVINGQATNIAPENRQAQSGKFYSGVNGACLVNFKAFRPFGNQKEPGVSIYINEAFSLNTGDKVAGGDGRDPAARFSQYAGKSSDVDPTQQKSASGF